MPKGDNTKRAREEREARALAAFTSFMEQLDSSGDELTVAFIGDLEEWRSNGGTLGR